MRLSAINTRLSWKTKFAAAKIQKQPSRRSVKEGLQGPAQVLSCECCENFRNFYFEKHQWAAVSENQHFRQYPNFNILLKFILNFAMAKWFCYVTCFAKIFLLLLFLLLHLPSDMLSFLHRWDYCWKWEVENYDHHDEEQIGFLWKSTYQNTEQDVLVIFIARNEEFQLLDKICTEEDVKCHIQTWRKLT